MYIKELVIKNFRNYLEGTVNFVDGLNVICGHNASGKTNLVESVYYCALGKSPRATREKELIKWDSEETFIKLTVSKRFRDYQLKIYFNTKGERKIYLDSLPIVRISDLIGIINVVYFSPDELSIIKDSPVERRKFIDIAISQQKKSYFTDLINYNKIIDHRNKLLKTVRSQDNLKQALIVWDMQLAKVGARIINNRYLFVEALKTVAASEHSFITDNLETLTVEYESKIAKSSPAQMEEEILLALQQAFDKDYHLQYTTVGAHRDDLKISINDKDSRKFASQGQTRTAALSLKLAELVITQNEIGEKPILILDDVLSELDDNRRAKLMQRARCVQTLLTCTAYDNNTQDNIISISNGQILE